MTSINFPFSYHALGCEPKNPITDLQRTIPSLQPNEVLIKVSYASINPMDPKLLQFNFFNLSLPMVLGFDFSGTVVAVGSNEAAEHGGQALEVGSEVMGFTVKGGCFGEYTVAARSTVVLRGAVPAPEGSTYGVAFNTAYESVEVVGEVSKRGGQWVYIAGGSGGVGHFAVQLAKMAGAKVISSASKPEALALLRSLGVDHVIDYRNQDVVKEVLSITGGKGADFVYEPTYNPSSYAQSASVVASGGKWVKLGSHPDAEEATKIAQGRGAQATVGDWGRYHMQPEFVSQIWKMRKGLEQAVGWYTEGKVKPHVSHTVPYEAKALQQAIEDIGAGKGNVGKVVVKVSK